MFIEREEYNGLAKYSLQSPQVPIVRAHSTATAKPEMKVIADGRLTQVGRSGSVVPFACGAPVSWP